VDKGADHDGPAAVAYIMDAILNRAEQIVQMRVKGGQAPWVQHDAARTLTAGGAGGSRTGLRMSAGASPTFGNATLMAALLCEKLLLLPQDLEFGLCQTQSRVRNGLRRGHGRPSPIGSTETTLCVERGGVDGFPDGPDTT